MNFPTRDAREDYILENVPLVISRVLKINGHPDEDCIQEGIMGLIKAVDRFDPSLGNQFSSFAVVYIDGHIRKYRDFSHTIKSLRTSNGTKDEIHFATVDSFSSPVPGKEDVTLGEILPDPADVISEVLSSIFIRGFEDTLSPKQREVYDLLAQGYSQREISDNFLGVNYSAVCWRVKQVRNAWKEYATA